MLYVKTVDAVVAPDGTATVVLECDGVTVRAAGLAFFDEEDDNDWMLHLFEEWHEMAVRGETGYTIIK